MKRAQYDDFSLYSSLLTTQPLGEISNHNAIRPIPVDLTARDTTPELKPSPLAKDVVAQDQAMEDAPSPEQHSENASPKDQVEVLQLDEPDERIQHAPI